MATLNIYRHRYTFKNIVLTLDKDYPIREEMAISFAMVWDYSHRTQPVIQFTLQLEKDLVVLFYQNRKTAKIKFDIYEMMYDENDTKINTSLWLQHSFSIVPVRDITHYINAQDIETIEWSDPMSQPQGVEMYLIDRDIYNQLVKKLSVNVTQVSKPAILQSLFESRDIPGKTVIATPPEDSSVVPRTVLELGTLVGNIDELNTRYGIYTAKALIFHDLEYLYCLNRIQPNIQLKSTTEFDTVTFILANSSTPDAKLCGGVTDTARKTHFINLPGAPEITDYDTMINSMEFSTVESIDYEGTVDVTTLKSDDAKMEYIYEHNPLSTQQEINERILTDQVVSMIIADSPISFFKPYKTYNFLVDTQYSNLDIAGHQYRLNYLEFGITKEGSGYESTIQLMLYRIDNKENIVPQ